MKYPDYIQVETTKNNWIHLEKVVANEQISWSFKDISVTLLGSPEQFTVCIHSSKEGISRLQLEWIEHFPSETRLLGDAFERGYGDFGFEKMNPSKMYPWYFMATSSYVKKCFGVKTNPNALCSWIVSEQKANLWMDVRNGTNPIMLKDRKLEVATVVQKEYTELSSYDSLTLFCKLLCDRPKLIEDPIVGGNDWYYAYGNNSRELILENARFLKEISQQHEIKPWMVIDDGWQVEHDFGYNGGPWHQANAKFGSMKEMAEAIKALGVRPGIWIRPLLTRDASLADYALRKEENKEDFYLDISHPEVLKKVSSDIARIVDWGFELIKHDFTTVDIFGWWGKEMDVNYTPHDIHFFDKSKTTAELIKQFYQVIREAAGDAVIIGCNTISHLSAEVFEMMRTGDDTSGRDFAITLKNGVNTLAFRMPQHKTFYLADADCIGITDRIPWKQNKKWLEILSLSGTPLFVSCNPREVTDEIKKDLQHAFSTAFSITKQAVPLDWEKTSLPTTWKTERGTKKIDWK